MYSRPWRKTPAWLIHRPDNATSAVSGCITAPDGDVKTSYQALQTPHGLPLFTVKEVLCRVGIYTRHTSSCMCVGFSATRIIEGIVPGLR
ncbi:hypothetical protein EVG59_12020 [Salmonella enterica subsp. enterica serovar Dortmund]|nr:hypothetical protein [Salmonella enterica subsp. enterica serovar Dortmund]ECA8972614.1 hypothetical protein [Salmonella enterica subsp. enterica serovar Omuna]ECB1959957.1 hypothetical protein [Salmonella enterica subsp. enterica serovar Dortmund]ECE0504786.1 hypothetical protein [Salmonella enterica subsp. enterica]